MKRFYCLILCIALVGGILYGCQGQNDGAPTANSIDAEKSTKLTEANADFAFDIFKVLNKEDTERSVFISPLSISMALSMTYNGAETSTKEAMAQALNYNGIGMEELNKGYKFLQQQLANADKKIELDINNSIWVRKGEAIQQDFLDTNQNVFNAYVNDLDFSKANAAEKINGWISKATKEKIKKMINPPIPANVVMYLINAIYFKGQWTEPFDEKLTFDEKFKTENGKEKPIKMMNRTGKVEYGQGEGYKAVRLSYGNGRMAMYCLLPEVGTKINDFITRLDAEKWEQIKSSISEKEDVVLQIPRFKLEYGVKKLNDSLTDLGMGEAFSEQADFSGIRKGVFISEVLHKAVIEVNEEGSEAAAATVVAMMESAALELEPITFIADRPFVFAIVDDETDTILFMGKMFDVE